MKILAYKQLRFICVLGVAASFGLTGCKGVSSWKMPKMAWNREPSRQLWLEVKLRIAREPR